MPNQADIASHCVVQWDDIRDQYAIVDTKRSKTVATLKVGVTTLFEGYQRERRRGKILFLGSKKDCFAFGFDVVEDDTQLNTYSWSSPPGLREKTDEITQAIRNGGVSSLQRTASSSSTGSSSLVTKTKRKKLNNKNLNEIDELMQSSSSTRVTSLAEVINLTTNDVIDKPTTSSNNGSTSITNLTAINTEARGKTPSHDHDSILEEIRSLREKNLALEDQLIYQREISIPLPSEEIYNYLKSVCSTYEQIKSEHNQKVTELGRKLPCTNVELKLAKKNRNAATTINNLVKCCFKGINLKDMSYTKLKAINSQLLEDIHEYVKHIHAPRVIPQTMFSAVISLKCRHLREGVSNKKDTSTAAKDKQKQQQQQRNNNHEEEHQAFNEELVEDMDENKENEVETF